MSTGKLLTEASALGRRIRSLSDDSAVKMKVWIDAIAPGDRAAIAQARLEYEETIAMWMDAHERLGEVLRMIVPSAK